MYYVIILLSLVGLWAGVTRVISDATTSGVSTAALQQPSSKVPAQNHGALGSLVRNVSLFIFDRSLWLVFWYFLVAVLVHFDWYHWFAIALAYPVGRVFPKVTYNPGWINTHWHVKRGPDAIPVYPNIDACKRIADRALTAVRTDDSTLTTDYAEKPDGISHEEMANVLLLGNTIESGIHDFLGKYPTGFKALYGALTKVARRKQRPFAGGNLKTIVEEGRSFYCTLREMVEQEANEHVDDILPDNVAIDARVTAVVKMLVREFDGCGLRLAKGTFRKESGHLVLKRLWKFQGFNEQRRESMRIQFLKLATCWGVWPAMKRGPFVYPFSTNVASLLLSTGCLRTLPEVKIIPLDPKQASSLRLAQGEAAGFTGTCRPYPSRLAG
jgi:hypothetical protein